MEPQTYAKYIEIDENFVAVFGEEVDKKNKDMWKTFIPHSRFYEMLWKLLPSLNREGSEPKPLWIFGAYGTGKTHAAFVIKHLLSDDINDVMGYLSKYEIPSNLRDKLLELRENNKILVVYNYGSSDITSERKLLLVLQDRIQKELKRIVKEQNTDKPFITKTEIELLKERLEDTVINWDEFIKKHEEFYEMGIESKEDILEKLNQEEIDIDFVEYLIESLEEDGISPSSNRFNVETFVNWLKEIFESGIVSRIVFIWDEFSDFFNQDHPPLTTLQKLAEITKSIPFYLILITHRHPNQFKSARVDDIQKIQARFNLIHYYMEPVTIYQLMSNVIQPKNSEEWKKFVKQQWEQLSMYYYLEDEVMKLISEEKNANLKDMKKLFPIHPYSVYLAARISQHIGSYQRTLFKFLKGGEKAETVSFRKFINEYPKGMWYLLTPDFLWEYFFVSNEGIHIFHQDIVEIINYWDTWKDKLSEEELKVFNVIMMLSALMKRVSSVPLLKPSREALKVAFSGTPLYLKLQEVINSLMKKGIIASIGDEFILPYMGQIDISNIEAPRFSLFIKNNEAILSKVKQLVTLGKERLSVRFNAKNQDIPVIPVEDLALMRTPNIKKEPYQLNVIFGVMKEETPLSEIKEKLTKIAQNYPNTVFIVSLSELGDKNWEEIELNYKHQKAHEKANRFKEAEYFKKNIDFIVDKWMSNIENGRFLVVSLLENGTEKELMVEDNIYTAKALSSVLNSIIKKVFNHGLDEWIKNDTLWRYEKRPEAIIKRTLKAFPQLGKGQTREIYNLLVDTWRIVDIQGEFIPEECNPQKIPVCAMRRRIKELFPETEERVSLFLLWDELTKPPFGLYPSKIGGIIFALLLKEFSKGYYYTDGINDGELDVGTLGDLITETITKRKEFFIQRLSYEQRRFSELLKEIFTLDTESKYPRTAIIDVRFKIKSTLKYPIWAIKYGPFKLTEEEEVLIDVLDFVIKNEEIDKQGTQLPKGIEEPIKDIVYTLDGPAQDLKEKLRYASNHPEYYQKGFFNFILRSLTSNTIEGELNSEQGLKRAQFYQKLEDKIRELLQEEPWAWREEEVKKVIQILEYEILLTRELSKVLHISKEVMFLEDLIENLKEKLQNLELLPLWMYEYHPQLVEKPNPDIIAILRALSQIVSIQDAVKVRQKFEFGILYEKIPQNAKQIEEILDDKMEVLKSWVSSKLGEEIDREILNEIMEEIRGIVKDRGPEKVSEESLVIKVRTVITRARKTKIKKEIEDSLIKIIGTSDIREFLRTKMIPVELIKYLPGVPENVANNVENLVRALLEFRNIDSENRLTEIKTLIETYSSELSLLSKEDIHYKIFRSFFGEDWIEGLLTKHDFADMLNDMKLKLGENVEKWTTKQIRDFYKEWVREKYKEEMYDRIQQIIHALPPEELKELVTLIIKDDPGVGLKIAKLIRKYQGESNGEYSQS
ncbi:hypothetical protein [Thermococcus thermotolerans]|uniref:hypothetical protein n=1 Tax=Thermococcus thermotolerans TaxID=2969672 RepID=UPI0021572477|nr:hypothetical protein [Thermococcus thermotolerans]